MFECAWSVSPYVFLFKYFFDLCLHLWLGNLEQAVEFVLVESFKNDTKAAQNKSLLLRPRFSKKNGGRAEFFLFSKFFY